MALEARRAMDITLAPMPTVVSVTQRQYAVGQLIPSGMSTEEIADQLFVSTQTVKNHLHRIYRSMGIADRNVTLHMRRAYAAWLLLTGRVELRAVERRGRGEAAAIRTPERIDFAALIDPGADPAFERRRLLTAFERYLDGRLG